MSVATAIHVLAVAGVSAPRHRLRVGQYGELLDMTFHRDGLTPESG